MPIEYFNVKKRNFREKKIDRRKTINTPFACASGRALDNFPVTGTLLSPVHPVGYVCTALKKSSYRENLSYEVPWFQRNLARATFGKKLFSTFSINSLTAPQKSCSENSSKIRVHALLSHRNYGAVYTYPATTKYRYHIEKAYHRLFWLPFERKRDIIICHSLKKKSSRPILHDATINS